MKLNKSLFIALALLIAPATMFAAGRSSIRTRLQKKLGKDVSQLSDVQISLKNATDSLKGALGSLTTSLQSLDSALKRQKVEIDKEVITHTESPKTEPKQTSVKEIKPGVPPFRPETEKVIRESFKHCAPYEFWHRSFLDISPDTLKTINPDKTSPLQISLSKPDMLKEFLKTATKEHINYRNISGRTALHLAAEFGHHEAVEAIIATGLAIIDLTDERGETAFHKAVANVASNKATDPLSIVRALHKAGADINKRNIIGATPRMLAYLCNEDTAVLFLMKQKELEPLTPKDKEALKLNEGYRKMFADNNNQAPTMYEVKIERKSEEEKMAEDVMRSTGIDKKDALEFAKGQITLIKKLQSMRCTVPVHIDKLSPEEKKKRIELHNNGTVTKHYMALESAFDKHKKERGK